MNNLDLPEYMFALWFLLIIEDNFAKLKQQTMKELSIHREQMNLEKSVLALSHITVNYLHFRLVSMETTIL